MAERLSEQEIDAAVCRVAKTHFDDAALIERHMTDLEKRAESAEQELSRLRACVVLTPEQAGQVRDVLEDSRLFFARHGHDARESVCVEALTLLSTNPQPPTGEIRCPSCGGYDSGGLIPHCSGCGQPLTKKGNP